MGTSAQRRVSKRERVQVPFIKPHEHYSTRRGHEGACGHEGATGHVGDLRHREANLLADCGSAPLILLSFAFSFLHH